MALSAPSRDRLPRPVDISSLLPGATRRVNLIVDEPGLRRLGLEGWGSRNVSRNGGSQPGGPVGSAAGIQRGQNQQRMVMTGHGTRTLGHTAVQNGGRQGRRNLLPSWHPRTPLRDITGIARAIERRRAELGLSRDTTEGPQEENNVTAASRNAQLEPEFGTSTPVPTTYLKPEPSPATQAWRVKSGNNNGDSPDFITPQKKLLYSIDKVCDLWLKEQQKLERTPAAKRAVREQKVRVLMSMR